MNKFEDLECKLYILIDIHFPKQELIVIKRIKVSNEKVEIRLHPEKIQLHLVEISSSFTQHTYCNIYLRGPFRIVFML